jgi:hypothetical protein
MLLFDVLIAISTIDDCMYILLSATIRIFQRVECDTFRCTQNKYIFKINSS